MRLNSKAVAILIMFLFSMASVVPIINGNMVLDEPYSPVTSIFFNEDTGMVTLVAVSYPLNEGSGVNATYYKIDGGPQTKYTLPFKLPEGKHTIKYWSIGNNGVPEYYKTATFTYDSTPPTVEIIKPEDGKIYFFSDFSVNRIFGDECLCIGEIPVSVIAEDGNGTGIDTVFFSYGGDSGYDDNGSNGWTDTYTGLHFGRITISVTAVDNKGILSDPVEKKVIFIGL